MQYPNYQQAGWPIGSGIVESANKRARRSTAQRSRQALGAGTCQSDAGLTQRGLQSALAGGLADLGDPAPDDAEPAASRARRAAADPGLLATAHGLDAPAPPDCLTPVQPTTALFLAPALSPSSPCFSGHPCKKLARTLEHNAICQCVIQLLSISLSHRLARAPLSGFHRKVLDQL
jgi:hypothetical protein